MKGTFHQARWDEPLAVYLGAKGRRGARIPPLDHEIADCLNQALDDLPKAIRQDTTLEIPELSEIDLIRHYTRLSQKNFGVDCGFYPLGSCTMKFNPKINEKVVTLPGFSNIHPQQNCNGVQGALRLLFQLERWLCEITGMDHFTLQPAAGSHGEFVGLLIIRAYHKEQGEESQRTNILIPDSGHGTNPASAAMAGFSVTQIPSGEDGCINIDALEQAVSDKTAGLMLTNPNTLGIFEREIDQIEEIIHDCGGLLYYDGANLNAIMGIVRPGDMGFDLVHCNLHKTFSTPHGGGGPGAGPVGVVEKLEKFLPVPIIDFDGVSYNFNWDKPASIGKVSSYYGNFGVLVKAYSYILTMGGKGLKVASEMAVLNANYLARRISQIKGFSVPYINYSFCKHEFVVSVQELCKETGVTALDVSKYLLDNGIHPPTIYFPLIVPEALMIEPTETEGKETLDSFVEVLEELSRAAYSGEVEKVPLKTAIDRVDEVTAAKNPILHW